MDIHGALEFINQRRNDYACMNPTTPVSSLPVEKHMYHLVLLVLCMAVPAFSLRLMAAS